MPRCRVPARRLPARPAMQHIAINGQKGYHGVCHRLETAVRSSIERRGFCGKVDARHIAVTLDAERPADRACTISTCQPVATSPTRRAIRSSRISLASSTRWQTWMPRDEGIARRDAILVGDLNVAPLEHDVWSHKALIKSSVTRRSRSRSSVCLGRRPLVDVLRRHVPADRKCYTWWSYRSPDWAKADKGRRLDHIWVSESLGNTLAGLDILKEGRGWERPSDHVPGDRQAGALTAMSEISSMSSCEARLGACSFRLPLVWTEISATPDS